MATAREIRRRIRSIKNIAKVTGALEAVSASRVQRAQSQALASRAYAEAASSILEDLGRRRDGTFEHPLLTERPDVKNITLILITSDRGLAGPYNANVIREAVEFEQAQKVPVRYITVGRKGRDLMVRRGATLVAEFSNLPPAPSILDITPITRAAVDDFLTGAVDEVHIAYTRFINTLRQQPKIRRLLPLHSHTLVEEEQPQGEPRAVYSFEPDPRSVLDEILPRFVELILYQSLLEALASEHSARMVAMRNATENANALVDDLTLSYNKARQLAITSEILDIVGGAEALAQAKS
ncbi:MAG TPA: ATP synthase F1 subunit gamma [Chloroflexi bacterium]|nr:ATP synthase F1 subunit gamma [Chloroflexota bacterium]